VQLGSVLRFFSLWSAKNRLCIALLQLLRSYTSPLPLSNSLPVHLSFSSLWLLHTNNHMHSTLSIAFWQYLLRILSGTTLLFLQVVQRLTTYHLHSKVSLSLAPALIFMQMTASLNMSIRGEAALYKVCAWVKAKAAINLGLWVTTQKGWFGCCGN
jgi:hypothetical protein